MLADYSKIKYGLAPLKVRDLINGFCSQFFFSDPHIVYLSIKTLSHTNSSCSRAGLPVYFIEPHHPDKLFWRGQLYGEHDDFKRFSFFSRAALELLLQSGKTPDIIHCHDWQTAFVVRPIYSTLVDSCFL